MEETKDINKILLEEYYEIDDAIRNYSGDVRDNVFVELQKQKGDILNDLSRIQLSKTDKEVRLNEIEANYQIKKYEQNQENKRNIFKIVGMGLLGFVSLGVTIWQTNRAYKFDTESTFTSTLGRSTVNEASKVNPRKFSLF